MIFVTIGHESEKLNSRNVDSAERIINSDDVEFLSHDEIKILPS